MHPLLLAILSAAVLTETVNADYYDDYDFCDVKAEFAYNSAFRRCLTKDVFDEMRREDPDFMAVFDAAETRPRTDGGGFLSDVVRRVPGLQGKNWSPMCSLLSKMLACGSRADCYVGFQLEDEVNSIFQGSDGYDFLTTSCE